MSHTAYREYAAFLEGAPDVPTRWIDVVDGRPLSQRVAADTGVKHESPQALLLEAGAVVWHASHGAITRDALAAALAAR